MTDSYYFHKIDVKNNFKKVVEDIFNNEDIYNDLKTDVYVIANKKQDRTSFPCIFIDIMSVSSVERMNTSTSIQRFSDFTISFDIYSKTLKKYAQDDAATKIAEYLIDGIQKTYNCLVLEMQQPLPNLDRTVSREQVRFSGTLDNLDNNIYSN